MCHKKTRITFFNFWIINSTHKKTTLIYRRQNIKITNQEVKENVSRISYIHPANNCDLVFKQVTFVWKLQKLLNEIRLSDDNWQALTNFVNSDQITRTATKFDNYSKNQ